MDVFVPFGAEQRVRHSVCHLLSAPERRPPAFGKQAGVTQPIIGPKVYMVSYLLSVSERACLKHEENGGKFPRLAFHIAANVPVILISTLIWPLPWLSVMISSNLG